MTKMTLTKMTRLGLLVKYNNISCWCVWMEILVVKFCEYHFFVLGMVGKKCEKMAGNLFLAVSSVKLPRRWELFFVLELCRDRAVAYQWVQLGGADILSGMSKNLTKIGWRGNGNRDKSLVSSDLIRMQCGKKWWIFAEN